MQCTHLGVCVTPRSMQWPRHSNQQRLLQLIAINVLCVFFCVCMCLWQWRETNVERCTSVYCNSSIMFLSSCDSAIVRVWIGLRCKVSNGNEHKVQQQFTTTYFAVNKGWFEFLKKWYAFFTGAQAAATKTVDSNLAIEAKTGPQENGHEPPATPPSAPNSCPTEATKKNPVLKKWTITTSVPRVLHKKWLHFWVCVPVCSNYFRPQNVVCRQFSLS